MRSEDGFTIIEVMVAALVLVVGVLGVFLSFSASQKLTLLSERHTVLAQRAQLELDRVKSLPYAQVALTQTSSSWSTSTTDPTYVSNPANACPAAPAGSAPTYQPDHSSGGSTATEFLVVNGCTYTIGGSATTIGTGTVVPVSSWSDGRTSGQIFDFITWASDPTCSETTTPGSACATTNDYKRITVVAVLSGVSGVKPHVIESSLMADPNASSSQNLLKNPTTSCTSGGQTVSCSNTLPGTPIQYFPCDSSYQGGSCSPPPCGGNVLDKTLVGILGLLAPAPDLLGSSLPSGSCTSGTTPTPPCYATNLLSGCQGLPIGGTGSSSCGSPPLNNSQSHSWVTPALGVGTTLNGTGSLTAYLMSTNSVAVNVNVCLGLYLVPGGLLGNLLGNLLQTPIGVAVSANVTAQANVPTPVSFNFNAGLSSALQINALGTRVEVVVWVAASASTSVSFVYDQAQFASQITLMTT